jgi:hypothetical protein
MSSAAADVLGPDHPVARSARFRAALAHQLVASVALVALSLFDLADVGERPATVALASAVAVLELCLAAGYLMARTRLREQAADLIADGGRGAVPEVEAERRRLDSPRHRARLARELATARHAAEHWHEIAVGRRPPPSICGLIAHRDVISAIVRDVTDPATSVRAIALLDRLLRGGYAAPLYVAPAETTVRDLGRIRFLLADQA